MRDSRFILAVVLIAIFFLVLLPSPSWAVDAAATIFKSKCAACHGADGLANTPMGKKQNIPSFASDKVQKCTSADLEDFVLYGGKDKRASHAFAGKGISNDDAKKLAIFIKELGKKK